METTKKKIGRPVGSGIHDAQVKVRMPKAFLERIDEVAARTAMNRSDAIRYLIAVGMAVEKRGEARKIIEANGL